ncbi:MAG: enoyl-CoA hydratase-related protein [Gammaproteobacteria bacterium]|nr:enoyl-CoA hydratase-related protein [Gammaproteobacteria bacterium]
MPDQDGFETLSYRVADSGVAFITIDVTDRKLNVLTPDMHREIGAVADRLAADDTATGAVIHSGKSSFLAGGDLKRIVQFYAMQRSAEEAYAQSRTYTESLRKLETCGKPVCVAINGTALGGGLELALACHHRVVLDDPDILLGLPEVTLGLIPGGGGTQRLPRMIGIKQAASLILSGERFNPTQALDMGVVDELASAEELLSTAETWVLESGVDTQPWDRRGFRIPGGSGLSDQRTAGLFLQLTAKVSAEHRHNYPAPVAALRCLFNGTTVKSIDAALKIETREFSALTRDPVARNIVRTQFINKGIRRRKEKESPAEFAAQDESIVAMCQSAYMAEGQRMLNEGLSPSVIENVAFAAGMASGPLGMAASADAVKARADNAIDVEMTKSRLLCIQALAAAEGWAEGSIDPIDADLASIEGAGFPAYTGGVMSYVDTIGTKAFLDRCDQLATVFGDRFAPSVGLRAKVAENRRVYPPPA